MFFRIKWKFHYYETHSLSYGLIVINVLLNDIWGNRCEYWLSPSIRPRSLLSPLFPDFPLRHLTLMVHWTPTTPSYQELMLLSGISTFLIKLVFVTRTIQFKTNHTLWMNDVWKTSLTNLNPFFFDSNDLFAGTSSKWLGIRVYISACLSRSEFRLSGVGSAEF